MTSNTPVRKQPTDRKKSAEQLRAEAIEARPDGADLLVSVDDMRSADMAEAQADILDLFDALGIDLEGSAKDAQKKAEYRNTADEFELDGDVAGDVVVDEAPSVDEQMQSIPINGDTIRAIGKLGAVLERYVAKGRENDYAAFDRGRGAQQRVMDLAMWFLGELGE